MRSAHAQQNVKTLPSRRDVFAILYWMLVKSEHIISWECERSLQATVNNVELASSLDARTFESQTSTHVSRVGLLWCIAAPPHPLHGPSPRARRRNLRQLFLFDPPPLIARDGPCLDWLRPIFVAGRSWTCTRVWSALAIAIEAAMMRMLRGSFEACN